MFSSSRFAPSASLRSVAVALESVPAVGFSGSRAGFVCSAAERAFCSAVPLLPTAVPVLVGDARGVDAAVRSLFPSASVFRVSGSGRGAFAARSVALVRGVSAASGSLLVFPGAACPVGLLPAAESRACFCGLGSGSWASAAFALGLGCPVLLWVPSRSWVPGVWGLEPLGGGWFAALAV